MSMETTLLKDVFKSLQTVTSLTDSENIVVADSGGSIEKLNVYALDVFVTLGHWFRPCFYNRANTVSLNTWKTWVSKESDNWSYKVASDRNLFVVRSVSVDGMPVVLYNVITAIAGSRVDVIPILLKTSSEWIWNSKVDVAAVLASILPDTLGGG